MSVRAGAESGSSMVEAAEPSPEPPWVQALKDAREEVTAALWALDQVDPMEEPHDKLEMAEKVEDVAGALVDVLELVCDAEDERLSHKGLPIPKRRWQR